MKKLVFDQAFWNKKRVLVTGHTGFKGSWLCLWLAKMGARVTGIALEPPTIPSLFNVARVKEVLERSVIQDIRDRKAMMRLVCKLRPEIIIHMAAQPLVRDSYKDPVLTYETNVMGTINLFEAVRSTPTVCVFLNVTTDKCYANYESRRAYRETDPLGGYDPYSSSKACSELITAAYTSSFFSFDTYREHGVAVATARAGNVIGGGDWAKDRLVPDCIRALRKKRVVVIRHPQAVRPWQHVLDPLCGYLMLAQRLYIDGPQFASSWNFGPEKKDVLTVRQIADNICRQWGGGSKVKVASGKHPHEAGLLMLDIAKARKDLGWNPRLSIREALAWTVEWYRLACGRVDPQVLSLQQIKNYQERFV